MKFDGKCPYCRKQIMVCDTDGKFKTFKANYRQAYLTYSDAPKRKIALCVDCLEGNVDLEVLNQKVNERNERSVREFKKSPESMSIAPRARQGEYIGKSRQGGSNGGVKSQQFKLS